MSNRVGVSVIVPSLLLLLAGAPAFSATLEVGPGKPYPRVEDANAAAAAGDVVKVYPLEGGRAYEKVAVFIRQKNVQFEGVLGKDGARVKLSGTGFDYTGDGRVPRAIFQFNRGTDGCSMSGFDLSGAHNKDHNGAGVRINQANDVTVLNCEIHDNDMGIMSNGDGTLSTGVRQRIECCLIHHNGNKAEPGQNHNLYLGGTSVVLCGCEVHSSLTGHNVKSRAHLTALFACYIHHSANRECDLVDGKETAFPGSDAILVGNVIEKDPECPGNHAVIHFGQDVGGERNGTLYLVNDTISTPFLAPVVDLSSPGAHARLINDIVYDAGSGQKRMVLVAGDRGGDAKNASGTHNFFSVGLGPLPSGFPADENVVAAGKLPFVDPRKGNYRLAEKDTRLVETGLPWAKCGVPNTGYPYSEDAIPRIGTTGPEWQYKSPVNWELRVEKGGVTLGAYAWGEGR